MAERSDLCKEVHVGVDRRFVEVEKDVEKQGANVSELARKVTDLCLQHENRKGMIKGVILLGTMVGSLAGALVTLLGIFISA
jgi:hypothetical protein